MRRQRLRSSECLWLFSSSSQQRDKRYHQKSHTCPEQASGQEPHDERDDACWQDEQEDFGDQDDYDDAND
jgi:hypothetical protein